MSGRRSLAVAALLLTAGLVASSVVVSAPAAQAGIGPNVGYTVPAGGNAKKAGMNNVFLGTFGDLSCIDYRDLLTAPTAPPKLVRAIAGVPQDRFQTMAYLASQLSGAVGNVNDLGAAYYVALNLAEGDALFRADWYGTYQSWFTKHHPHVVTFAGEWLQNALLNKGTPKVAVSFIRQSLPGQIGVFTVKVTAPSGHPIQGAKLHVTQLTGASLTGSNPSITDAGGSARFMVVRNGTGTVTVTVQAETPNFTEIYMTFPPGPHYQRLVKGAPWIKTSGSASYNASIGQVGVVVNCPADCDGHPVLTATAVNSTQLTLRFSAFVNGSKTVSTSPPVGPGKTVTWSFPATNTDQLQFAYASLLATAGNVWDKPVQFGSTTTVVCPPLPKLSLSIDCSCLTQVQTENTTDYTLVLTAKVNNTTIVRTTTVAPHTTGTLDLGGIKKPTVTFSAQYFSGSAPIGQPRVITTLVLA